MATAGLSPDGLFPPVVPRASGFLAVGQGHELYWEECGPRDGFPVVFLHGGPGSGCNAAQRRLFDPRRFRAVLFDQRGCGRSRPLGETADNTTAHLVADLEKLRRALGIAHWIVCGGSWGSALGLAYAQAHPESVAGLVLRGIFLGSGAEVTRYLSRQARPEAWAALAAAARDAENLLESFGQQIRSGSEAEVLAAAGAWLNYERAFMGEGPLEGVADETARAKVRVQLHYLCKDCFLAPEQLLRGVSRIRHLPAVLVQGMADPVCPPEVAQALARAWPEAQWSPVAAGGHGGLSSAIAAAVIEALAHVAARVEMHPPREG
ncbi:MAG: prolyl aminopeptidase [Azonexus sp.]|nr:prolyl aminopeptidase [Betaproteobacteria bacterium]MBP6035500.1 prolyl aminopeptidase [Azonexus sp.]MBP6906376.1 prolyl aminopeptidase [Azonexus sp.]